MNICLFCDFSGEWNVLKKHLMQHMQLPYLCPVCDANVSAAQKQVCELHTENAVFDSDELDFTMYWVWNFIEYSKNDLVKYTKKPVYCCVVCEKVRKIGVNLCMDNSQFDEKFDSAVFKDHLRSHLRYYRYYCNECKMVSSRATLRKHVKNIHKREDVDNLIRHSNPVRKLENLILSSKENFLTLKRKYLEDNPMKMNGSIPPPSENNCTDAQKCDNSGAETCILPTVDVSVICPENYGNTSDVLIENGCGLKECSVVLTRLSDEDVEALKADIAAKRDVESVTSDKIVEEEEIEIPDSITHEDNEFDANQIFVCIFCDEKELKSYSVAFKHYQVHLDYYPFKCSICDEVNLSLNGLFQHFREQHKEEKKAIFQRCENEVITKWVKCFLTQQVKSSVLSIKSSCPVCEALHKEILNLPLYSSTSKSLVTHVLKHLCYEPFVCMECLNENKLVTFNSLANQKTYYHVLKLHHDKIFDNLNAIIKKKRRITRLETFITQYLSVKDIKYKDEDQKRIPNFVISKYEKKMNEKKERLVNIPERPAVVVESSSETLQTNLGNNTSTKLEVSKQILKPAFVDPKNVEHFLSENSPLVINVSPCDEQANDNPFVCRYFCIFCETKTYFSSKLDACSHIAEHLSYFPVVCLLCSNKFSDLKSLMSHHTQSHATMSTPWGDDPSATLLYVVNEDEDIEKWIEDFLDFQNSGNSWNLFSVSFQHSCIVCRKLLNEFSSVFSQLLVDTSLKQHIHQHLNYYPYECIICRKENRETRLPVIDKLASDHLLQHGIANISNSANSYFVKTIAIKSLEVFISEAIVKSSISRTVPENEFNLKESKCPVSPSNQISNVSLAASEAIDCFKEEKNHIRCYHCQVILSGWLALKEHHFKIHPGLSLIGF